ncbi:hypothetical protein M5689_001708 [Euphorbia peplus]|nr:hypothetical protein M5689_001708 [Euphorbia peplus]
MDEEGKRNVRKSGWLGRKLFEPFVHPTNLNDYGIDISPSPPSEDERNSQDSSDEDKAKEKERLDKELVRILQSYRPKNKKMKCEDIMENVDANQLPEVDAMPDGFVDGSTESLAPRTPNYEQEKPLNCNTNSVSGIEDSIERVPSDEPRNSQESSEKGNSRFFPIPLSEIDGFDVPEQSEVMPSENCVQLAEGESALPGSANLVSENPIGLPRCSEAIEDVQENNQSSERQSSDRKEMSSAESIELQKSRKPDVSNKLDKQKEESFSQLEENKMLRHKLKQLADQYTLSEQQYEQKLKHKSLELQLADLKMKQHEEKLLHEQSQMKVYAEQVSQLLSTEKNLRLQLTADGEKFQQVQDALVKSKQEIEKMGKSIKELKKENEFLKSNSKKSDVTIVELAEEGEKLKKQLDKLKKQREKFLQFSA